MKITSIALRNIFRNKRRSVLSLSAISVATLTIVFMFSIIEGMKVEQRTMSQKFVTGEARLRNADYEQYRTTYPDEVLIKDYPRVLGALKTLPAVKEHAGRLPMGGQIAIDWEAAGGAGAPPVVSQTANALVIGLDFQNDTPYFSFQPYLKAGGRLPEKSELLVADGFARKFGFARGDALTVFGGNDSLRLTVSGIVSLPVIQLGQNAVFLPLEAAQELKGLPGQVQEIMLAFDDSAPLADQITKARETLAAEGLTGLKLVPWTEVEGFSTWLELASAAYNFIALFFFIIATTVIVNTTIMVIFERMREIGTLRAMGMTGREIIRLFFTESFFISAAGAFLGALVGIVLVLPLSVAGIDLNALADVSKMEILVSNVIYPQLNLYTTLFVFVYAVAIASLVTFLPTRRAAKIEPVEALRSV